MTKVKIIQPADLKGRYIIHYDPVTNFLSGNNLTYKYKGKPGSFVTIPKDRWRAEGKDLSFQMTLYSPHFVRKINIRRNEVIES